MAIPGFGTVLITIFCPTVSPTSASTVAPIGKSTVAATITIAASTCTAALASADALIVYLQLAGLLLTLQMAVTGLDINPEF